MFRTACYWLGGTAVVGVVLLAVALARGDQQATSGITAGVAVSLATLLASQGAMAAVSARHRPLERLLIETSTRLALPLAALLALIVARRELLTTEFVLYFVPFPLVTLVVGTVGAVQQVRADQNDPPDSPTTPAAKDKPPR